MCAHMCVGGDPSALIGQTVCKYESHVDQAKSTLILLELSPPQQLPPPICLGSWHTLGGSSKKYAILPVQTSQL